MTIKVLQNNVDYVSALHATEIAQQSDSNITTVASFLSSVYFPDETLNRFFANTKNGDQIATLLIERKQFVKSMILSDTPYTRVELYEIDAISRLVRQGRPHEQERSFHLLPSEIEEVLKTMLTLLAAGRKLTICFTRKVVPLDYCVFTNVRQDVLIDIRSNYDYQTIQGLHIHSELDFAAALRQDAELLRLDTTTTADRPTVCAFVSQALLNWQKGSSGYDAIAWPKMLKSGFC